MYEIGIERFENLTDWQKKGMNCMYLHYPESERKEAQLKYLEELTEEDFNGMFVKYQ